MAKDDLSSIALSDNLTLANSGGQTSLGTIASPNAPTTLDAWHSFKFSYTYAIPSDGSFDDSLLTNTVSLNAISASGGPITASAQASVAIGAPPAGLPPSLPALSGGVCPPLGKYGDPRQVCDPVSGICTSYPHEGIDTAIGRGTPVKSPFPGVATATSVGNTFYGGNYLTLTSGNYAITFRHLQSVSVSSGDTVFPGQVVAFVNNTGVNSTGDHLHTEVRDKGTLVDPCSVGVVAPCCP